ncbi:hypothetical protein ACFL6P_02175 [Candidatus Latescibacterota bacterium]
MRKMVLCLVLSVLFIVMSCAEEQSSVSGAPDLGAIRTMLEDMTYDYAQA